MIFFGGKSSLSLEERVRKFLGDLTRHFLKNVTFFNKHKSDFSNFSGERIVGTFIFLKFEDFYAYFFFRISNLSKDINMDTIPFTKR